MSASLPNALRARFQQYIEEGLNGQAAAARVKLSPATGSRWACAILTRGCAEPARQMVAQDPDITLFELRDALAAAKGVAVHHFSIAAPLSRIGFTYKQIAGGQRAPPQQGKAGAARLASVVAARSARSF